MVNNGLNLPRWGIGSPRQLEVLDMETDGTLESLLGE
jgi:hypothetical protein